MSEKKGFFDSIFDAAEGIVGQIEMSKDLSGKEDIRKEEAKKNEELFRDSRVIDIEPETPIKSESRKNQYIFASERYPLIENDKDISIDKFHVFESLITSSSICGDSFEPDELKNRKTKMNLDSCYICGICIRILVSKL